MKTTKTISDVSLLNINRRCTNFFRVAVAFFVLMLPGANAWAINYYFNSSATGNDNNNGTSTSTPWKTITKANALNVNAGDTVRFFGGQTFSGTLSFNAEDSGTAASPVVIGSYGTGRATLNAGNANGIYWENCGGIVIRDLVITGSGASTNNGSGILITNNINGNSKKDYLRIFNVTATGFGATSVGSNGCGIHIGANPSDAGKSGFRDVQVAACTTYANEYLGIYVTGYWQDNPTVYANENVTVRSCVAYNNLGDASYTGNWSGCGIFLEDVKGALIEYCTAYGNGGNCPPGAPGGPVGIWTAVSRDVIIQYCESYNNSSNGWDGGGFDLDGGVKNSTIQYCYSHGNKGAGYLLYIYGGSPWINDSLTVRYCLSENDGSNTFYGGITLAAHGDTVRNVWLYNNTLIQGAETSRNCLKLYGSDLISKVHVHNNLLISQGATLLNMTDDAGIIRLEGNAYWSSATFSISDDNTTYSSLAAWRTSTNQEKRSTVNTGIQADPMLSSFNSNISIGNAHNLNTLTAYKLQTGSPLINAGLDMHTLYTMDSTRSDFWGNTAPKGGAYDIGANEFQGALVTAPPSNLMYAHSTLALIKDSTMTRDSVTFSGSSVDSFTISPALPAGLFMVKSTGVIYGKPTAVQSAINYTLTARNLAGSATATISISVSANTSTVPHANQYELGLLGLSSTKAHGSAQITFAIPLDRHINAVIFTLYDLTGSLVYTHRVSQPKPGMNTLSLTRSEHSRLRSGTGVVCMNAFDATGHATTFTQKATFLR